jgi:hypothetical protein
MMPRSFPLAVCLLALTANVFAQDDRPITVPQGMPLRELNVIPKSAQDSTAQTAALSGSTIPTWGYSVVSPVDGKTYTGQIIGVNPATRPAHATVIPTVVVPVRLVFQYSSTTSYTFDPTANDNGCLGAGRTAFNLTQSSPLINDASFVFGGTSVGNTQYMDAFQRANFWSQVSLSGGGTYRTLLGFAPMPLQSVTVTSANSGTPNGTVYSFSGQCGTNTSNLNAPGLMGVMNISFFDPVAHSLITKLGISPNSFVIFLFYNAVMSNGNPTDLSTCCILGYHSVAGSQTYAVAEFEGRNQTLFSGVADVSTLSHEIGEWMNDPLGNNLTPLWGNVGQVSGCQGNYEVGDPLSGSLMAGVKMSNGFTYHLQELAFFSWFFRLSPSGGVNGWYSNKGTFTSNAGPIC